MMKYLHLGNVKIFLNLSKLLEANWGSKKHHTGDTEKTRVREPTKEGEDSIAILIRETWNVGCTLSATERRMTLGLMMRYGLMYVGASLHESVCRGRSRERSVDPPYIQALGITVD